MENIMRPDAQVKETKHIDNALDRIHALQKQQGDLLDSLRAVTSYFRKPPCPRENLNPEGPPPHDASPASITLHGIADRLEESNDTISKLIGSIDTTLVP